MAPSTFGENLAISRLVSFYQAWEKYGRVTGLSRVHAQPEEARQLAPMTSTGDRLRSMTNEIDHLPLHLPQMRNGQLA